MSMQEPSVSHSLCADRLMIQHHINQPHLGQTQKPVRQNGREASVHDPQGHHCGIIPYGGQGKGHGIIPYRRERAGRGLGGEAVVAKLHLHIRVAATVAVLGAESACLQDGNSQVGGRPLGSICS